MIKILFQPYKTLFTRYRQQFLCASQKYPYDVLCRSARFLTVVYTTDLVRAKKKKKKRNIYIYA